MSRTFLSVCDGLGCANLAFSALGWTQVLSSEIDAAPRSTLAHHLGAVDARRARQGSLPLWGDFTALRVRHLRRMGVTLPDVLCGGTPCQSFSVAGQRGGMTDPRGELTIAFLKLLDALDAARLADGLPPVVALWENVPGVLNHPDNPFGHVLSGLVGEDTPIRPAGGKWSDAGLAVGPTRAAAWRVLDAQYFGLAQRRERVFVVASAREGFDPAAVLLEPDRVRRHSPPSREAGEGPAATITGGARQRGGYSHDDIPLAATLEATAGRSRGAGTPVGLLAYGGNDTRGPIEVSTALNAHGGPHGRMDFESETFIAVPDLATTLRARDGAKGVDSDATDTLIAFDTTQITSVANRSAPKAGDPCHPLAAGAHPPAIAFSCKDHGGDATTDLAPTLRAMGHADSHANAGGQLAVAFALRGRDGGAMPEVEGEGDTVGTLRAAEGGSSRDYVAFGITRDALDRSGEGTGGTPGERSGLGVLEEQAQTLKAKGPGAVATAAAVRRLTPRECCRLQGVPDNYFDAVLHRGKPLADGPIYKMLGNGWAVPVVRWIGERIEAEIAMNEPLRAAA